MRLVAVVSPQVFVSDYPADDAAEHSKEDGYEFVHGHALRCKRLTKRRPGRSSRTEPLAGIRELMRQQQATASCWINCGDKHRKNRQTQGRRSFGLRHRRQSIARSRAGDKEKQTLSVLQCVFVSVNAADIYNSVNQSQSHSTMFFYFSKPF
jgi:hypothetical protein